MKVKSVIAVVSLFAIISCKNSKESFSKAEVIAAAKELSFPENDLYFIKPELREEMLAKGQPNTVVFDKQMRKLEIGTCYEEYPFFMDAFFSMKSQLKDTLQMYDLKQTVNPESLFAQMTPHAGSEMAIDSTKKYYHFYYFADYAREMDAKLKPAITKYQDSVQFFFISIDQVK